MNQRFKLNSDHQLNRFAFDRPKLELGPENLPPLLLELEACPRMCRSGFSQLLALFRRCDSFASFFRSVRL